MDEKMQKDLLDLARFAWEHGFNTAIGTMKEALDVTEEVKEGTLKMMGSDKFMKGFLEGFTKKNN